MKTISAKRIASGEISVTITGDDKSTSQILLKKSAAVTLAASLNRAAQVESDDLEKAKQDIFNIMTGKR